MEKAETVEAFYAHMQDQKPEELDSRLMLFNFFRFEDCQGAPIRYRRREYYKVTFLQGRHLVHYGDKSLEVNGSTLAFFSPDVPYTIDMPDGSSTGFYFIFKEQYFTQYFRRSIRELPLFASGQRPAFVLDDAQTAAVGSFFNRIQEEFASDYPYRHDLIRNCITDLVHFAMRLQPVQTVYPHMDANVRITAVFNELMDRQFPIEDQREQFMLRTPGDVAAQMGIHVNHLNRALQATTGKSTSRHIAERLVSEASTLLKHSGWNVAEIGYSLGFEDPAHFSHFFKKQTGQAPSFYR